MDMNEYQQKAGLTAKYHDTNTEIDKLTSVRQLYPYLGLAGESGELLNKIKKIVRDDNCIISIEKLGAIKAELGDVLWYLAAICTDLGFSLAEVANDNVKKLLDRHNRDKISGSGDKR